MKTQFVPLSQAHWLGRGLLAFAAKDWSQCPPPPPREPVREQDGVGGQTLSSRVAPYVVNGNMGPFPCSNSPSHPVGI